MSESVPAEAIAARVGTPRQRSGFGRLLLLHPIQQFRRDPHFYLRYDATYFVLCAVASAALYLARFQPLSSRVHFSPWSFLFGFPLVVYALIYAHLWIHNATHGSFPPWLNRIAGEILGFVVFVRYASWQIVHLRHHARSDHRELDPHPNYPSYLTSFFRSIVTVERQLQDNYCEVWGENAENRRREVVRARVSYGTNVVLAVCWYLLLGPVAFFGFWLPGNLLAAAFIGHFNWSTHNGEAGRDFRPVNLDHGYYWLGNRLFTGIYFHANHHSRPHLFNPRRWDAARHGVADPVADCPRAAA